jgi:alpha-N-arabinofuranosidase
MKMERRQFLKNSAMAGVMFAFSGKPGWAKSADASIQIFLDESRGTIAPEIYGHFTEHIGGVIYDGVWVGENSKIPNKFGIRSQLIEQMNKINVPILRWPGGCFADSYDWRDGVGPESKRPVRTNFWEVDPEAARLHEQGPQIFEPNTFGTDEFMRFCKLTSAQPYLAANLRSLPALEFDHWVEYCNSPAGSTTLADMRKANGSSDPYGVRYWGVGNESWGCGGNFEPAEYASAFRRYTNWIPKFGVDLQLIAAGPNSDDSTWTQKFFEEIFTGDHPYRNPQFSGWSVHHYASNLSRGKIMNNFHEAHGQALNFDVTDWYELMRETARVEDIMSDQWAIMGEFDQRHHVKLVVDEYGPWYHQGTEVDPTHLFGQQITVRDALATAMSLDIFNRHCDKVSVATCAQLVNNLNALFLCHEEHFLSTPNFYVFEMYKTHQGGQSLRTEFAAPDVHYQRDGKPASFWSLNGSSSRKGNVVTLTVVNADLNNSLATQVALRGGSATEVKGTIVAANDMHAHNTFENPNAVQSAPLNATIQGNLINLTLPAASVVKLEITVA